MKNYSIPTLGTMPQTSCGGLITPIYNSSGSNNPANFRGMSVSSTWEKCFVRYLKATTPEKCHVFKYPSQLNFKLAFLFLPNNRTAEHVITLRS